MDDDNIVRIPNQSKLMGSCPDCGRQVWSADLVHKETEHLKEVYRCIRCKILIAKDDLIPF